MKAKLRWFGHSRGETNTMPEESIWRLYHLGGEKEDDRSRDGWTVSNEARLLSEHQKMKLILSKIDLEPGLFLLLPVTGQRIQLDMQHVLIVATGNILKHLPHCVINEMWRE